MCGPHDSRLRPCARTYGAIGLVGLVGASSGACGPRTGDRTFAATPGTELFAVAPETLREITASAADRHLYAYRWRDDESFHLVVVSRGREAAEQCVAGPAFARWLTNVARVPIVREATRALPAYSSGDTAWVEIRLRDASRLDPIDARLRFGSGPDDSLRVEVGNRQYVTGLPGAVLRQLRAGCRSFASRS